MKEEQFGRLIWVIHLEPEKASRSAAKMLQVVKRPVKLVSGWEQAVPVGFPPQPD